MTPISLCCHLIIRPKKIGLIVFPSFDGRKDISTKARKGKKLPDGLVKALSNDKPVIILMNPPYGTANNMNTDIKAYRKQGVSLSKVNSEMVRCKFGF